MLLILQVPSGTCMHAGMHAHATFNKVSSKEQEMEPMLLPFISVSPFICLGLGIPRLLSCNVAEELYASSWQAIMMSTVLSAALDHPAMTTYLCQLVLEDEVVVADSHNLVALIVRGHRLSLFNSDCCIIP
jgi:hypothetical protein